VQGNQISGNGARRFAVRLGPDEEAVGRSRVLRPRARRNGTDADVEESELPGIVQPARLDSRQNALMIAIARPCT
jgi:hypothetical protein